MGYMKTAIDGHVAELTIARPEALNALSREVLEDLHEAFCAIDLDVVRAVILTDDGTKSFVAGADIASMARMKREEARAFSTLGNDVFLGIESFPVPVIAAVNGYALGGGMELALAADIRLAAENALFGQPECTLGITPGFGGTQRLARVAGTGRAAELIYTGRTIDAATALAFGIVNAVYPQEQLLDEARKLAGRIAQAAPIAVRASKRAILAGESVPLEHSVKAEEELFSSCFETADQRAAMEAFLSKERPKPKPVFQNS